MERYQPQTQEAAGQSPTRPHFEAIEGLAHQYGASFYAYLQIADQDQDANLLREDFLARYQGAYYDFEEFARAQLSEVGITRLRKVLGVELTDDHPDDIYLTAAHLRKLFYGVPIDSRTYVFRREPQPQGLARDITIEPLQIDPLVNPPAPRIEISWPGLIGPTPESRRHLRILERLYDTFTTAFEVYLEHIWTDASIEELEDDMLNVYQGSYSSVAEFIDALAKSLDWKQAIDKTIKDMAIPPGAVTWNYRMLYHDLTRDFEFYQSGNQVHVFHK